MTTEAEAAPEAPEAIDTAAALEAEFAAPKPADDASAAPEAKDEPEGEQPPAKPKQTAQERIDELTRARRDAERRADELEARLSKLEKPADTTPPAKADDGPDPEDFEAGAYDPAYTRALARWEARQAVREEREEAAKAEAEQSADATFKTRLDAAATKHPDFNEKVLEGAKKGDWDCSPTMFEAIKDSDLGTDVAYHLANNPDEARRIAALSPLAQIREIGRIEARIAEPEKPVAKTATDAPEPAPTARGAGGKFKVSADTNDFASFEAQYGG